MKIAIIGAGAIGSVVAAYLTKAGQNVVLIGRDDQVRAIQNNGLKVSGVKGDETFQVKGALRLSEPVDLAIFTVKTQDMEEAYQHNHRFLDDCLVLSSQNGVQADNILSSHFEPQNMLSSIVMFAATYIKPGEVTYNFPGDWIVGKPFSPVDQRVHDVVARLESAFDIVVSTNIMGMKWLKLFVNFNNCIAALVGTSMQETFADMDMCRLSIMLLKEGLDVVHKAHIELVSLPSFPVERVFGLNAMPMDQAAGIINKTLTTLSEKPLYGSILQSIMRGRTSEIDFINGEVVCMARQMRQDVPLNARIVDMVREVEQSQTYFSMDDVKEEFGLVGAGSKPACLDSTRILNNME